MNPFPSNQVTASALALLEARKAFPDAPGSKLAQQVLKPYVRESFFEHSAPITLDAPFCYAGTGLRPPEHIAEWLAENVAGAWALYLTKSLNAEIAFELDADRVLYRIRFPS